MTYTATGKQVLRNGQNVAQAASEAYATAIAAALNTTSIDRGVASPLMREQRGQGVEVPNHDLHSNYPDPSHAPNALRTLSGDDGRLDIYRGGHRLGYLLPDDSLWLLEDDGFARNTGERIERAQIASAMARYKR
jgi:hypothetical protein